MSGGTIRSRDEVLTFVRTTVTHDLSPYAVADLLTTCLALGRAFRWEFIEGCLKRLPEDEGTEFVGLWEELRALGWLEPENRS